MFDKSAMLYFYVETPLHAGSGRAVGVVDLPIQRERSTNYPLVQASGVKGRLRAEAKGMLGLNDKECEAVFGPEKIGADSDAYAGAVSFGDARLLLFPVRSVQGVFAWATSANVLARYVRDLAAAGVGAGFEPSKLQAPERGALVSNNSVLGSPTVVLEEFSYEAKKDGEVDKLADYLSKHALPQTPEYKYWRDSLASHLLVLPENDFRDFVSYATEVVTRVRLTTETKTVARGALWTEESLPSDTLLYAPLYIGKGGTKKTGNEMSSGDVQKALGKLNAQRVRLGGDETTGRGTVALCLQEVKLCPTHPTARVPICGEQRTPTTR